MPCLLCARHNQTDIDFYEIRNGWEGRRRPGGRSGGWGPEGQARLWVSPGDVVPSFLEALALKGKTDKWTQGTLLSQPRPCQRGPGPSERGPRGWVRPRGLRTQETSCRHDPGRWGECQVGRQLGQPPCVLPLLPTCSPPPHLSFSASPTSPLAGSL